MKKRNRILAISLLAIVHFTNAQKKCEDSKEKLQDLNSITKCTIEKKATISRKESKDRSIKLTVSRRSLIRRKRLVMPIDTAKVKKIKEIELLLKSPILEAK